MPANAQNLSTLLVDLMFWQGFGTGINLKSPRVEDPLEPAQINLAPQALPGQTVNIKQQQATPSEGTAAVIREVLGNRALDRFTELRNIQAGWNFGEGSPMSAGAEKNFVLLLSKILDRNIRNPLLFLMDDGGIEIQWKNRSNRNVSVVVTDDSFELFAPEIGEKQYRLPQYRELLSAALSDQINS